MSQKKTNARGDRFRDAFSQAKIAFQRSYRELSALITELKLIAKSISSQLGIDTLLLPDGRWVTIFVGNPGIVLFYSDGSSYFAVTPCL